HVDQVHAYTDDHRDLLDGDGLGEIARLIHVEALCARQFHRKNLKRDNREQRLEEGASERDRDDLIRVRGHSCVPGLRNGEDTSAASADLLDVGHDLRVHRCPAARAGNNDKDRLTWFYERDGSVLQLPGREPFGVNVRKLFEL